MMRSVVRGLAVAVAVLVLTPAMASASTGVEHLHFQAGPYLVTPGANLILLQKSHVPKPAQDGYMVRMAPNLHYARPGGKCCGGIPRVDVIHLHHGVWLSNGTAGAGEGNGLGGFYPFAATGEEKTVYQFPAGYGYPIGAKDYWVLNYMIHNLTANAEKVYITYDIDFIPSTSPAAKSITPVHPIWMDVESHNIYPVFDVHRFSGRGGKFTFPDMAKAPYAGAPLNQVTLQHPGTLVATAGHLHPGGLYDDLALSRAGTSPGAGTIRGGAPGSVRLFRSSAHYWDKRGPISWDMAMGATAPGWRPRVKAGDVMRVSTTYETRRASWYESMGIMVVWEAWNDTRGVDPFTHSLDESEHLTHGHLAENNHHGGSTLVTVPLSKFRSCARKQVLIAGFTFLPGDLSSVPGTNRCLPTVKQGQSLSFLNEDASPQATFNLFSPGTDYLRSIFHAVTACQSPCGLDTGISYPLANGAAGYDSGQLGFGTPAIDRLNWSTPSTLAPGTYTYYCRIHPFMRGAFKIIRR